MADYINPNVENLSDYVEEKRLPLIASSIMRGKTIDLIQLETGVKQDTALNLLSAATVFGDGSVCGWDPEGFVALSQRILHPVYLKVNQAFCDKNLLNKWASYEVNLAAGRETLPFAEKFFDEIGKGISQRIEFLVWMGDSNNTNEPDGFITILGNEAHTEVDTTGMTAYNAILAVYNAIPVEIIDKDDLVIFVSESTYRAYIQELIAMNLFHYDPQYDGGEYRLPGTNVRVIAVNGLNATVDPDNNPLGYIVAGRLSNFFYGCGAEDDKNTYDFWYSKDNREFRLAIYFSIAVQIAFPFEVVTGYAM